MPLVSSVWSWSVSPIANVLFRRILFPLEHRFVKAKKFHCGNQFTTMVQTKIDVQGVKINYDQTGNGPLPVICMPGALGFIESDFGPILPKFSKDKFTVITWDPPGYGKSRPPNRDFTGQAQFFHRDANWANELMKTLGFSKYSVLGWSDGGITALIMATKYPSSIDKLVVWGGNAYITETDMKLYTLIENIDNWSPRMKAPMIDMYGEEYFRQAWTSWVRMCREVVEQGQGDLCKEEVKKIQCPSLIIHGMKDAMVPYEHAEYLHKNIKNSKIHIMEEGKHNLHIKYADEFIPLVEKFLLQ